MTQHEQTEKRKKTLSKDAQTPIRPTPTGSIPTPIKYSYTNGFGYWHLTVQQARLAQTTKIITNNTEHKA